MDAVTTKSVLESYLALVCEFPLYVIKTEEQNDAAIAVLERLGDKRRGNEAGLDEGEEAYYDVLFGLVHDFEKEAYPIEKTPPARMIKFLMEFREMNQIELAKATGIPTSTLSDILLERGNITPKNRNALATFFKVDPSLFV